MDQNADGDAVVLVAQADVVQASAVAQGDPAAGDLVVANAPVPVAAGGRSLRAGGVDLGRGAFSQGSVRPGVVVGGGERVELGLQCAQGTGRWLGAQGTGRWLGAQPLLHGLLEALDLALGLGVVGASVLLVDAEDDQLTLEGVGAVQESGGEDQAVEFLADVKPESGF